MSGPQPPSPAASSSPAERPAARRGRARSTRRSCSAPATTSPRTASPTSSSACPAASTRRSSPPSPSTRSAPTACTACSMPSRYSSDHSITDAERLADNLGIDRRTIAIEPAFTALRRDAGAAASTAASPTSPRRTSSRASAASLLMALSNKFGWLVLTTGNKSESAVGYSTLYGDTAGGFAVIKDVPKLLVYELCRAAQRAGRPRAHPRGTCSPSRRRPSCAPTSATTRASRPTRCSTRSSRPTSSTTAPPASSIERRLRPGARAAHRRASIDLAEYKRRQTPPGRPRHHQGLRQGPPPPHHQPLPRLRLPPPSPPNRTGGDR